MTYCIFSLPPVGEEEPDQVKLAHSLRQAFQKIPDPRRGAGRRYSLVMVLGLICLAKMAGQTTLKGITDWARL